MDWRWRKRKKIFPGVTLNLSNKSTGVTLGGRAGRISLNSSGRTTVGQSVPDTGLHWSQAVGKGKKRTKTTANQQAKRSGGCGKWLLYGVVGLLALMGCGVLANLMPSATPGEQRAVDVVTTETPSAIDFSMPEPTTVIVPTEAPVNMPESTPMVVPEPTPTIAPAPAESPTAVAGPVVIDAANVRSGPGTQYEVVIGAQPGQALVITGRDVSGEWLQLASGYWIAVALVANAPANLPVVDAPKLQAEERAVPVIALPTESSGPPCECSGDLYKCDDFGGHQAAQTCFNYCISIGAGDIHRLDNDNDGTVCEN